MPYRLEVSGLTVEQLKSAWSVLFHRHRILRLSIAQDKHSFEENLATAENISEFHVEFDPFSDEGANILQQSLALYDPHAFVVELRYMIAEDHTFIILYGSHSAVDGRTGMGLVDELRALLAGEELSAPAEFVNFLDYLSVNEQDGEALNLRLGDQSISSLVENPAVDMSVVARVENISYDSNTFHRACKSQGFTVTAGLLGAWAKALVDVGDGGAAVIRCSMDGRAFTKPQIPWTCLGEMSTSMGVGYPVEIENQTVGEVSRGTKGKLMTQIADRAPQKYIHHLLHSSSLSASTTGLLSNCGRNTHIVGDIAVSDGSACVHAPFPSPICLIMTSGSSLRMSVLLRDECLAKHVSQNLVPRFKFHLEEIVNGTE